MHTVYVKCEHFASLIKMESHVQLSTRIQTSKVFNMCEEPCLSSFCPCKLGHKLMAPSLLLILETCMGHYLLNQTASHFKIVYNFLYL
jgi:hypothetical protein